MRLGEIHNRLDNLIFRVSTSLPWDPWKIRRDRSFHDGSSGSFPKLINRDRSRPPTTNFRYCPVNVTQIPDNSIYPRTSSIYVRASARTRCTVYTVHVLPSLSIACFENLPDCTPRLLPGVFIANSQRLCIW